MIDAWFQMTRAKCELVFEMKLELYGEACNSLINKNNNNIIEIKLPELLLTKPLKVRKTSGFIDVIEEKLHMVYAELDDGYTLQDEDKTAFKQSTFNNNNNNIYQDNQTILENSSFNLESEAEMKGNPELYGELTSKGVRQLHTIILHELQNFISTNNDNRDLNISKMMNENNNTSSENKEYFHSLHNVVAIDIGSGTGKLLFEWSLLAQDEPILHCSSSYNNNNNNNNNNSCYFYWTHVGLELAPSRMRIARVALPNSCILIPHPMKTKSWIIENPENTNINENIPESNNNNNNNNIVLGEVDVFTPGLLSNETFSPLTNILVTHSIGNENNKNNNSNHLVIFCCGLGFSETAVRELCQSLESMWLTPLLLFSSSSSLYMWNSMICIFLFRPFKELEKFPLFRLCTGNSKSGNMNKIQLETTWMSEAPAWLLSFNRYNKRNNNK